MFKNETPHNSLVFPIPCLIPIPHSHRFLEKESHSPLQCTRAACIKFTITFFEAVLLFKQLNYFSEAVCYISKIEINVVFIWFLSMDWRKIPHCKTLKKLISPSQNAQHQRAKKNCNFFARYGYKTDPTKTFSQFINQICHIMTKATSVKTKKTSKKKKHTTKTKKRTRRK